MAHHMEYIGDLATWLVFDPKNGAHGKNINEGPYCSSVRDIQGNYNIEENCSGLEGEI